MKGGVDHVGWLSWETGGSDSDAECNVGMGMVVLMLVRI